MSFLKLLLSPVIREFWIGRTFVHQAEGVRTTPGLSPHPDLEFSQLTAEDIQAMRLSPDQDLQRRSASLSPCVRRFAARLSGAVVGVCTFAFGDEYARSGGFYDLAPREAELADIFTSPVHRGRGIAGGLIRFSTEQMHEEGFQTLYAKVWHSNVASSRAFLAAGWKQSCFFVRLYPRRTACVWHTEWRRPDSPPRHP